MDDVGPQNGIEDIIEHKTSIQIRVGAGMFAGGVGALVLIGWIYDLTALTQIISGMTAMNPVTAMVLIVGGTAMLVHRRTHISTIWAISTVISLIGIVKILQFAGLHDFAIDQLLFSNKLDHAVGVPPNRMAPNTAFTIIITGLAIASSKMRSRRAVLFSQALSSLIIAITLFALIGYILGIVALYGLKAFNPMALHTACALLAIAIAVLSANPRVGLLRVIGDQGPAGQLSRRVLPLVVLVPVVVGLLRLEGQKLGYYSTGTGVALQVFANVIVTFTMLMISIMLLHRSDLQRRTRELAVRRSEEEYRLAERLGRVGHWRLDLRTRQWQCSTELVSICGFPEGTAPSRDAIMAIHHLEDAARQRGCTERALRGRYRLGRKSAHHLA